MWGSHTSKIWFLDPRIAGELWLVEREINVSAERLRKVGSILVLACPGEFAQVEVFTIYIIYTWFRSKLAEE